MSTIKQMFVTRFGVLNKSRKHVLASRISKSVSKNSLIVFLEIPSTY